MKGGEGVPLAWRERGREGDPQDEGKGVPSAVEGGGEGGPSVWREMGGRGEGAPQHKGRWGGVFST